MKLKVGLVAALLLGGAATAVYAADRLEPTRVSALLKTRLPKTQVSQIDCDKVAGLCEVVAGKTLFYVDGTARYLIVGQIGRASGRARVCQYVEFSVVAGTIKKKIK